MMFAFTVRVSFELWAYPQYFYFPLCLEFEMREKTGIAIIPLHEAHPGKNPSLPTASIQVAVAQPAVRQVLLFFFFFPIAPLRGAFRRAGGTPRGIEVSLVKAPTGAFFGAGPVAVTAHTANDRHCRYELFSLPIKSPVQDIFRSLHFATTPLLLRHFCTAMQ